MKNFTHQSVIRNGNHFIKLTGAYSHYVKDRWMLIDGPWFDYLEGFMEDEVHLRPYEKMSIMPSDDCPPQLNSYYEPTVWVRYEKIVLAIGRRLPYHQDMSQMIDKFHYYERLSKRMGNIYLDTMNHSIQFGTKYIWWECNGGVLPAYLKNPNWDSHTEELFTYIT